MIRFRFHIPVLLLFLTTSCKNDKKQEDPVWRTKKWVEEHRVHNQLLDSEKEAGWTLLFDGATLNGWHLYNKPNATQFSAWEVQDGTLFCNATNENRIFGDLITDKTYENYELVFEWRMAIGGNGGVFINVQEAPQYSATHQTGPEYQLLEPSHSDTNTPMKRAGCLWGISPQANPAKAYESSQWNTSKIVQQNGKVEFYLNGELTAQEYLNTADWDTKIKTSRFKDAPGFGRTTQGKIALQNWHFNSWFRNIKIRKL